jgi:16S rRNA A1518/A1519 N6-dimethyltransferase RsmA/KsgA/DIM1 with predicted DNA glycosylase/AP lyase activity
MKRRRLGQHYLKDRAVVRRMVSLASISPSDRVLEIGTGKGALTRELVGLGARFDAYEVDEENFAETEEVVHGSGVRLHLADPFEQEPKFDILVSSLPYSESSRFVNWLSGIPFRLAVVLLQDDFARKILAPPGDRDYRGISALAQLAFDVKIVERVKRDSFAPQPRVNSVIVKISPKMRVPKTEASNIVRLFSLRRRRVDAALGKLGMEWTGGKGTRRVNALTPAEVHEICRPKPP